MRSVVQQNCGHLAIRDYIRFGEITLSLILPKYMHELANNITATVYHLKNDPVWADLVQEYFLEGVEFCPSVEYSDLVGLTLHSQRGLFYTCGGIASIGIIIAVLQAADRRRRGYLKRDNEIQSWPEHTLTDGELLRSLLRQVDRLTAQIHFGAETHIMIAQSDHSHSVIRPSMLSEDVRAVIAPSKICEDA
eukprot:TRINITY_DN32809_c0_g1_i1.p1 TRINITY_DN32809_c0_g1~~TRINITY_DN32809_c0_g1_i1.p1  ORF type:complete len:220 (-),score=24.41 TRINITY_DN32809_c0_g1_i1:226-801(-)